MKVILVKDVEKVGQRGTVTEVKDGFARNYLLPYGLAQEATPETLKLIKLKQAKEEKQQVKQREQLKGLADKLAEVSLTISAKAKNDEELFGSVSTKIISDSLEKEEGIKISKDKIELDEPIKKLGIYKVKINLLSDIKPELKVWVVKE